MQVNRCLALPLCAILLTLASFTASGGPAAADTNHTAAALPVYRVDTVTIAPDQTGKLVITAAGAVRTGGWTAPQLHLKERSKEPHTLVYDFVATPPPADAAVIQALVPQQATITIPMPRASFTQIRVEAETNSVVSTISRPAQSD